MNCMYLIFQMYFNVTHIFKEGNCCADKMVNIGLVGGIICQVLFGIMLTVVC
jgi:hypothetical protein